MRLRTIPSFLPRWLGTSLLRQADPGLNWLACLRALHRCDFLVVAGRGDGLAAFSAGSSPRVYETHPFGLRWRGPVINPVSRWMMVWAAKLATKRCYRDKSSRAYMSAQGVDETASQVAGDIAFLLPAPTPGDRGVKQIVVGVGIMNYRGWRTNEKVLSRSHRKHGPFHRMAEIQGT